MVASESPGPVAPEDAHEVLAHHVLADGFPLVLDLASSSPSRLVDERDGTEYLDFYTFFASSPLGMNPHGLADDPAFMAELATVAANKPANSDVATTEMAEFVATFARVLGDPELPHLFFVEGGALAVENALKAAFDWKSRLNEAQSRSPELGTKVLHLRHAFHGRSGYTMSLTNADPVKTDRFPKFDWPRISSPAIRFPLEDHLAETAHDEEVALAEAAAAFERHPHDVACAIVEPIQCEGGDRHFRAEFLLALQQLCHDHDSLFILDEVQTGAGTTGTPWCYQQLGLAPDVVAFGKKVQLGGVMAGRRVSDVAGNVFETPGRINSTWGGNLTDMVRSRRLLEIVESSGAMDNAAKVGAHLLERLRDIAERRPGLVSAARGRGVIAAVDFPGREPRDEALTLLRADERVLALSCGDRSIRFRPAMSISEPDVDLGCDAFDRVVGRMEGSR